MKKTLYLCSAALLLALMLLPTACETKSADAAIKISPDSTTIRYGETILFTASGGYDYTWELQQESWGTLSSRTGERVTYTSQLRTNMASGALTQVLTVTSTIEGDPETGATSNQAPYSATAEAYINHL